MEQWKSLKGIVENGDNYSVSSAGRVRNDETEQLLKRSLSGTGYLRVVLYKDGKRKQQSVHRLVATAFLENPDNKPMVNHIDGVKANNELTNLEWCTASENLAHAYSIGLTSSKGENSRISKFTDNDIRSIKEMLRDGCRGKDIAALYGVAKATITQIKNGVNWAHIKVDGFTESNATGLNYSKGSTHPQAKVTEKDVVDIRELYTTGEYTYSSLGRKYNISPAIVSDIIKRRTWKHVE